MFGEFDAAQAIKLKHSNAKSNVFVFFILLF